MNRYLEKFSIKTFSCCLIMMLMSMMANGQTADFLIDEPIGCAAHTISCTYIGTGATSWEWIVNTTPPSSSGSENAVFVIANAGTYIVTLTVNGGASTSQVVTVNELPAPSFVSDNIGGCAPVEICFTGSTTGGAEIVDWTWNLGVASIQNGQNPCVTYQENSNEINVQLLVEDINGCQGVVEVPNYLTIDKPPIPSFIVNVPSSCTTPFTPQITNTTAQNVEFDYSWSFPGADGNPTPNTYDPGAITYNNEGSFDITLTTYDGACFNDLTMIGAIVIDELYADFTISNTIPCQFGSVTLTDASNLGNLNYQWYHGATPVGLNAPELVINFPTSGIQTITLIVTTQDGLCTSEITKTIDVGVSPTIDFSADATSSCGTPFTANFTSVTTNAVSYEWAVSPSGQTSNIANPSFTFNNPGTYAVSLTATSANGCVNTVSTNLNIEDTVIDSVNVEGNTFTAYAQSTEFQWIDCSTGVAIDGFNDSTFTATIDGSFAVVVSGLFSCSDTSECINILTTGVFESLEESISVYPVPTSDYFTIELNSIWINNIEMVNDLGQVVKLINTNNNPTNVNVTELPSGIYFLKFLDKNDGQFLYEKVIIN